MDSQNITLETNVTIEYYNLNSKAFTNSTQKASLSDIHQEFISRLQPNSSILDFGCGSGRDSAAFKSLGFQVSAIDGSKKMCEIASEFSGIPVKKCVLKNLIRSIRTMESGPVQVCFIFPQRSCQKSFNH